MTAICKQIITRPSLGSTFWFEHLTSAEVDYTLVTDNYPTSEHWLSENVSSRIVEPFPTWKEYMDRRSELAEIRPDVKIGRAHV